ncbi:hypothetical protein LguiB_016336 [Lonicera macranthoides]
MYSVFTNKIEAMSSSFTVFSNTLLFRLKHPKHSNLAAPRTVNLLLLLLPTSPSPSLSLHLAFATPLAAARLRHRSCVEPVQSSGRPPLSPALPTVFPPSTPPGTHYSPRFRFS